MEGISDGGLSDVNTSFLLGVVQRVIGMEQLCLCFLGAGNKLNIVYSKRVRRYGTCCGTARPFFLCDALHKFIDK